MTRLEWMQYLQDKRITRGKTCVIERSSLVEPPPQQPVTQLVAPHSVPPVVPPPASRPMLHATIGSLQRAQTRQYFLEAATDRSYFCGNMIMDNFLDPTPTVAPDIHPPVGTTGVLMSKSQWVAYCTRQGFSGDFCIIDPENET